MFLIVSFHELRKSMRLARNRRQVKVCADPEGGGGTGGPAPLEFENFT